MNKKITLENIFAFRGQIMLIEKMKRKGENFCHCGLCEPPHKKQDIWWDAIIAQDHYDAVKIVVPMSKKKFESLRKTYKESFDKKEAHEHWYRIEKEHKGIQIFNGKRVPLTDPENTRRKRKAYAKDLRVYPLHKSVYDEFANYIYKKFGEPQFGKKKKNISGATWGDSTAIKETTRKYGTWVRSRTIGVKLYRGTFEFHVDEQHHVLSTEIKEKFRNKNTKKFRKKSGKLI